MHAAGVMRWIAVVVLAGCGPVVVAPESDTGTTSVHVPEPPPDFVTAGGEAVTTDLTTTVGTSTVGPVDPTTGSVDTSTSDVDSVGFIQDPDGGGGPSHECSTWEQDCPRGEKCMPWANDGGGAWNATRCFPVADDPKEPGEPCTVVESDVSGIDDCVLGAMCWDVDPETLMGECLAMCQGNEAEPSCPDSCTSCAINGSGVLNLCFPSCDPLAQNCDEGEACYPIYGAFACAPEVSGDDNGALGDVCEFINVCDEGLLCASPELVPGCAGASCCTSFCNVDAEDVCDALLPGTSCVPWFEKGEEPMVCIASGTVGFCAVPQ